VIEIWDEIAAIQRRMDELVREFLGPRARLSYPALPRFMRRPFLPVTDVFARGDDVVVRLELPGIDLEKDVSVTLQDGQLVIRGERRRTEEVKDEEYYRMEAAYGTFERRFPIPEGVDEKKILAEYSEGILEVTVPKAAKAVEAPKAKAIPVRAVKADRTTKAA
jgi:HSP20 family protein